MGTVTLKQIPFGVAMPTDVPKVPLRKTLATWWRLRRTNLTCCWWWAIDQRDLDMVHALARLRPSTREVDGFVLFRALEWSDPTALKCLLQGGADANARHANNCWDHLLHRAACRGLPEHAKALLEAGARLDVRDSSDYTPLGSALHGFGDGARQWGEGRRKVATLLLEAGAEVDQWQWKGRQSALGLAPRDLEILKPLLKRSSAFLASNPDPAVWFEGAVPPCTHPALGLAEWGSVDQAQKFLDLLKNTGAMATLKPADHPWVIAQVFKKASLVESSASQWLDMLEKNQFALTSPDLDGNGGTVWHVWANTADHGLADRWLSALSDHPGLLNLSHQPNRQGEVPWDIAQKKVLNSGRLEALRNIFAWTKQLALDQALDAAPAAEKARPRL